MLILKKITTLVFLIIFLFAFGLALTSRTNASDLLGSVSTGVVSSTGSADGVVKAAPTVSPAAGDYHATQSVTLTATGATAICYTIDGTTPACATSATCTTGSVYSSAISVASSKTIKSLGCYGDNTGGPVGSAAYTLTCSTASVSNGTVAAYSSCAITCNSGYTLSGSTCVASSGGSVVGGGGGGTTTTTTTTTETPTTTTTTTTTTTPTPTTTTAASQAADQIKNIVAEAATMAGRDTASVLAAVGAMQDAKAEAAAEKKYTTPLVSGLKNVTAETKSAITNFVNYGTPTTKILGAGERAGVVNSYKSAFGKVPATADEWSDAIKIANGRWPTARSATAESKAAREFKKVYKRTANMQQTNDNAAVTVIAYGLRPGNRNLNSERAAIKSFRAIYGHNPVSALAWDIVRAIAYSGAKR